MRRIIGIFQRTLVMGPLIEAIGMFRKNVLAVPLVLTALVAVGAHASGNEGLSSQSILRNDFSEQKYWPKYEVPRSIEFCGGDWCQEVTVKTKRTTAAWDAVFLMFYYFDANDQYRERRDEWATVLLSKHGKKCVGTSEAKAACALGKLKELHGFEYRRVQYDVGSRCSSNFEVKLPYFGNKGSCVRLRK
ncbi:hypothetical protein LVB77_20635 [Lysobacter sp. 5GHs7-4]|uniref:hypothetical protein n=1 Tax=Lysobacter sp. 5GHs7-4 TaxID=2904253 RepID=UPI001E2A8F73|nr:hypothetical protein [Lysobacter sp. 5GHs7-4]UHQ23021.1 hypothetical protein LVB77_20635 [Lysobacter sp. 5GHs7-4]